MKIAIFRQKSDAFNLRLIGGLLLAHFSGCTTLQSVQAPALPPKPAPVLNLPHPGGFANSELRALFMVSGAPDRSKIEACSKDFESLSTRTQLREELRIGARELVIESPFDYHWCFYDRFLRLEEGLRSAKLQEERQSLTLMTFKFAVAVARSFQFEFKDSRYLRFAIQRYRELSPMVFYRKVELTPEATAELAIIENPFGIWKPVPDSQSILKKYGLREERKLDRAPAGAPAGTSAAAPTSNPVDESKSTAPTAPALSDDEVSQIFEELER